jgi:DNA-binding SARP family transcriptional activator
MRFQALGPLRVWDGEQHASIRAGQRRMLLAVLLAEAGHAVSTDRLVDEIWGGHPPQAAQRTVKGYVYRLRRLLGGTPTGPLVTRDHGYELLLADGELDTRVFEELTAAARRAAAGGRLELAETTWARSLRLWQGAAYSDVPACPTVTQEAARLERLRMEAAEERLAALLGLGRYAEAATDAQRLVHQAPLREPVWEHLVEALFRCGRQGEALAAVENARQALAAGLDLAPEARLRLEPGARLRRLQQVILAGHPAAAVDVPATVVVEPASRPALPAQLPADVPVLTQPADLPVFTLPADLPVFIGRQAAMAALDGLLSTIDIPGTANVVTTIDGRAGVGKTALAVRWANGVSGRFPDGQLYIDLRGYDSEPPLRPIDALARFLRALGVPAAQVPADVDAAAALYRSVLAGKRILCLLDNANHPDQVRPLLPGAYGCLVLVTSRDQLAGLVARDGAVPLHLDALTPAEAG